MQLQKHAALREGRRHGATSLRMLLGQNAAYSPKKVLPLITGGNLIVANNGWFLEGVEGGAELFGDQAIPLELDDGQTAWILYRNGAVVLTVTEDELDALDPIEGGAAASLADPIGIARSLGGETSAGSFLLQVTAAVVSLFGGGEKPAVDRGAGFRFLDGLVGGRNDKCGPSRSRPPIATPFFVLCLRAAKVQLPERALTTGGAALRCAAGMSCRIRGSCGSKSARPLPRSGRLRAASRMYARMGLRGRAARRRSTGTRTPNGSTRGARP